jgi:hypothetical protein
VLAFPKPSTSGRDNREVGISRVPPISEELDDLFVNAMPIARRLPRLVEESGWTGWNKLGRIDSPSSPGTGLTVNVRRTATHERSAADPRAVAMR